MSDERQLHECVASQPYALCFLTISGAHLYGFPSADSDYDLRGAHVLPAHETFGFEPGRETVAETRDQGGVQVDLVTHDVKKFFGLLLKKNGYALEQVYSPLVVLSTPEHSELKDIAGRGITRHHHHHFLSFADHEWASFRKAPGRVKTLLYLYRVLLVGIHLMRTGEVESNLVRLNETFRLQHVADLIAQKVSGAERVTLSEVDMAWQEREYERLRRTLEESAARSALPERAAVKPALNDLLVRLRLKSMDGSSLPARRNP